MSLGLRGGAKLHRLLGLVTGYGSQKVRDLAQQARGYAADHGLEAMFRSRRTRAGWHVSLHPAAPDILFSIAGGYAVISAETSAGGPGYHAFVVGLVDYLSREHQWAWTFANAIWHFSDETGYYRDRDFAALQEVMAGTFATLSESLVVAQSAGPYYISLPLEVNLAADCFAATSLGFRDRAFFEQPRPDLFFPWWEEGLTAQTLKNMALCKMWLEIPWLPPVDEVERRDLENVQHLIDRAREHGADFADTAGIDDIGALLRDAPFDPTAGAGRIGYWRQDIRHAETGGWSVSLPACYREELSDDLQTCTLTHRGRVVYMKSEIFETELAQLEWPNPQAEGYSEYTRFQTDLYWTVVLSGEEDDDEEDDVHWHVWQGMYLSCTGWALVTAASTDANDAAWAEKVLRSVEPDLDASRVVTAVTL